MKLDEIAKRIDVHLKRFEDDPKINVEGHPGSGHPFFRAYCGSNGRRVHARYVSYQHLYSLTKAQAEAWLTWLDLGNVGKHYTALPHLRGKT